VRSKARGAHPLTPVMWVGASILCVVGIAAAIGRSIYPDDMTTRFEPVRTRIFEVAGRIDPLIVDRAVELAKVDGQFSSKPATTRLHVLGGALFFVLLPFQFSRRIRKRYVRFHRWSGRVLLLTGTASTIAGLSFGLLTPYAGTPEAVVVALVGAFFLVSAWLAWQAIRRRDIDLHREWVIRACAAALAISTIRLLGAPIDLWLAPMSVHPKTTFVIVLAVGWLVTIGIAEWWIRETRRQPSVISRGVAPTDAEAMVG
jgi:hypothetical protein